jgi:hypothetical protein
VLNARKYMDLAQKNMESRDNLSHSTQ